MIKVETVQESYIKPHKSVINGVSEKKIKQ